MWILKGLASKWVMGAAPLLPCIMAFQKASTERPIGVMAPIPVTTTRSFIGLFSKRRYQLCQSHHTIIPTCQRLYKACEFRPKRSVKPTRKGSDSGNECSSLIFKSVLGVKSARIKHLFLERLQHLTQFTSSGVAILL